MCICNAITRPFSGITVLAAAVGFLFLLGACRTDRTDTQSGVDGGAASAPPSVAELDPCTLLTAEEVERALDARVLEQDRPREANISPHLATCRYVAERDPALAVLVVMVRTGREAGEARIGFRTAQESLAPTEPVEGLGDAAYWARDQLTVLSGEVLVSISGDVSLEVARPLMELVLSRLGMPETWLDPSTSATPP